jgi:hypothetical protein
MGLKEDLGRLLADIEEAEKRLKPSLIANKNAAAKLMDESIRITNSWSGSYCGYHSELYYGDFEKPPLERRFSVEWGGLHGIPSGYRSREADEVKARIEKIAGFTFSEVESATTEAIDALIPLKDEISVVFAGIQGRSSFEKELEMVRQIEDFEFGSTRGIYIHGNMPKNFMTRDSEAINQGISVAAHLFYQGVAHECETRCASGLDFLSKARLLTRRVQSRMSSSDASSLAVPGAGSGGRVFIGHGRSPLWREMKDFLRESLSLDWEEFNRDSPAGLSTTERLQEMLEKSNFAFLVLTAEDEHRDGTRHARENVVHEAGLFQGRLGFRRAIIVLEEGCDEFSNIHGVGQLRFPAGRISAIFEEARKVLTREGLLK